MGRFKRFISNERVSYNDLRSDKNCWKSYCLVEESNRRLFNEEQNMLYDFYDAIHWLIEEGTFDIDSEVDLIYDAMGFGKLLTDYKNNPEETFDLGYFKKEFLDKPDSRILKTKIGRRADEIARVKFRYNIGDDKTPSHYNMDDIIINIKIDINAINILGKEGLSKKETSENIRRAKLELSPVRTKDKIAHELNHWLEDVYYDRKPKRTFDKHMSDIDKEYDRTEQEKIKRRLMNTTSIEIESLVQQMKQHKRFNGEYWDIMDISDVMLQFDSLKTYLKRVYRDLSKDEYHQFTRDLFNRFYREGLLSRYMIDDFKKFPNIS